MRWQTGDKYVLESIAEPGDNLLLTLTTVKPFPFLIILEIARLWLSSTASLFFLVTLSKPQSHKKILDAGEILPFQQETWPNLYVFIESIKEYMQKSNKFKKQMYLQ